MRLRNKKTGAVIDLDEWCFDTYNDKFYIARGDAEGDNIEYFDSLADLCSKYEDYKPTEPLIKDEKIRKAVRAWAEASDIEAVYLSSYETLCWIEGFAKIEFAGNRDWFKELEEGKRYTITELCGEEE